MKKTKQGGLRRMIRIVRTYRATLDQVWNLWTTRKGIESWWGPEGFIVKVTKLDVRTGGALKYTMIAVGEDQIRFMKNAGMSLATDASISYTDVIPKTRLAYIHLADFIPGVDPYDVATIIGLKRVGPKVQMTLRFQAMHNAEWTERQRDGWRSELGKLTNVLKQLAASETKQA